MTIAQVSQNYAIGVGSSSDAVSIPIPSTRNPTIYDVAYPLGQRWINVVGNMEFALTSFSASLGSVTANWQILSGSSAVSEIVSNAGNVFPSTGIVNIIGGGSVSTSGSGNTLTITAAGSPGITWNNNSVSGTTLTNNGYVITSGSQSFSLPSVAAFGDELAFMLNGGTQWRITQGAGQQVRVSTSTTTIGAGGSVTTSSQGNTIYLICTSANTTWEAFSFVGNLTIV